MAQLVLGAVGAFAGSFVGAPGLGFTIGSAIGGVLFAPTQKQQGPRLSDLKVSGTETGQPIPYFEGKVRTAGQIAWASDRREIANTQQAGKGGPSVESTTYTYEVDLLYLLSDCEMAALGRVWNNGKLVWNNLPSASISTAVAAETTELWRRITFYGGASTQLPDPVYEAAVGIGNAPAGRGRAWVFIEALQLGGGGQIPNLSFEVFRETTLADVSLTFGTFARPATVAQFQSAVYKKTAWCLYNASGSDPPYQILKSSNFKPFSFKRTAALNFRNNGFPPVLVQTNGKPQAVFASFNTASIAGGLNIESLDLESGAVTSVAAYVPATNPDVCIPAQRRTAYDEVQRVYVFCTAAGFTGDLESPFIFRAGGAGGVTRCPTISGLTSLAAWNGNIYALVNSGGFWRVRRYNYAGTFVDEVVDTLGVFGASDLSLYGCWIRVDSDGQCWVLNQYHGRLFKITTAFEEQSVPSNTNTYTTTTLDGVFYCESSFVAFGHEQVGTGPFTINYTFRRFKTPTPVQPTLQSVIERLCARADLDVSQYDASGLAGIARPVRSLAISQVTPIRQVIETLAGAYYFGGTLSDKLYFRARGGASVATIPFTDLGAGEGNAQAQPLNLKVANDLEIPAQIALTYSNVDGDYNAATEYSDRLLTGQTSTSVVPLPLGLTPAEAKGTADSLVADSAAAVFSTSINLLGDYARLEPTDVVTVTDRDGSAYRMRVTRKTEAGPVLTLDLVLDDASALSASGITTTAYTDSTTVSGTPDTLLRLLDIPILRDADDDVGFYAAFAGDLTPWPGAALYKSPDNATYTLSQSVVESAGMGSTTTALSSWAGGFVFDEASTVTVLMDAGTLSSYTRDQVFSGIAPAYLIGSEIVYALRATLVSAGTYTLTGFLRGMRGTEWAMAGHVAGEAFTVLSTAGIRRETLTTAEIGALRYFKAPTLGRPLSTAEAQTLTLAAIGKKPFAPVNLRRLAGSSDPLYGQTSLILLFDGANGSTTFTDSSPWGRTMTPAGGAQISTAQAKYGGASGLFNGTNAYVTAATSADFQFAGDFTVEAWIYVSPASLSAGTGKFIFDTRASAGSTAGFVLYQVNDTLNFFTAGANQIVTPSVLTASTWIHVAVSRASNNVRIFVNGVQSGSTVVLSANFSDGLCAVGAGAYSALGFFDGYIDDLRVTKAARYSGTFTPPAAISATVNNQATITFDRRTRYAKNFTNGFVPLGESVEAYEVDVYTSNTYATVIRTLSGSLPSIGYSNAQQIADFGALQSTLYVDVYQLSAVVGRGYRLRGAV